MSQFFNSISDIAKNYKPYEKWEQNQSDIQERKKYLIKQKPLSKTEKDELHKKAANIVRVSEIMDTRSEDNAQDMEMLTQTVAGTAGVGIGLATTVGSAFLLRKLAKLGKVTERNLAKYSLAINLANIGIALAVGIGFILWGNSKTKEASRLGRFQAKIHELKDAKNFVQFTPEQLAEAEKIAATMPDEKQKKSIFDAIARMKENYQDKKAYKQYKKELKGKPDPKASFEGKEFSKEQLEQAAKDKEILLNVIKKVNNTAEDYSENVETAFDTLQATSFLATIPLGLGLNKLFNVLKLNIPKKSIATAISLLFPILVTAWGTTAEKKASRVGRYVAKQEILKDPEILRNFSDEEMKSVEHIKAPEKKKGFFKKIADNFKFIPQYIKDNRAYEKYIKEERPKNEKLAKALLKVEVTDEQLKSAKHLQEKTFMSFDKMDEMSQRYSEDMEAAAEIGKNLTSTAFSIAGLGIMAGLGYMFTMGKFPTHKLGKLLSKFIFKKDAAVRKTVDSAYEIINKDKSLKQAFKKLFAPAISDKEKAAAKELLLKNPELARIYGGSKEKIIEFIADYKNIYPKLQGSFNDNCVAKWARNLLTECGILFGKAKVKNGLYLTEMPYSQLKEARKAVDASANKMLDFFKGKKCENTYQRYKTLINTGAVAGIPILGTIVGVPYAINAWLTDIQKKAGRIGIMKAVTELDDKRLYVNGNPIEVASSKQPQKTTTVTENSDTQTQNQDMLAKFVELQKKGNNAA